MLNVALVGLGAIGQDVVPLLLGAPGVHLLGVLVRPARLAQARTLLHGLQPAGRAPIQVASDWSDLPWVGLPGSGLLVECAGHGAITEQVLPALAAGIPCVLASVGALAAPGLIDQLEAAARAGGSRFELVAGAIGAIDALAAAALGGLDSVHYTGTKPALAWRGTPAEGLLDLAALSQATAFFEGTAREAAAAYPRNANVAATVGLAGLGLDATRVRLVADPHGSANSHHVQASGAFGEFTLTMRGKPLAGNPKTSALTVYSLARAVINHARPLVI